MSTTVAFQSMGRPDDRSNARIPTGTLAVGAAVLIGVALVVGALSSSAVALVPAVLAGVLCVVAARRLLSGRQRPGSRSTPSVDPFAVGEPWRQFVQRALRSDRELSRIVDAMPSGALRDRLTPIAERLANGVQETWRIAQHGDALDAAVSRLDPVALRSRLHHIGNQSTPDVAIELTADTTDTTDITDITDTAGSAVNQTDPAIDALQRQLDTVDRIQQQSDRTARSLQLTQLRVEELVARAAEVSVGTADTEAYAHDVDDLVVELEALRLAIDEIDQL